MSAFIDRVGHTNFKHGKSFSPEYTAWQGLKNRCLNPNCSRFKNYGGRGIKVCARWVNSFENFYEDMGGKPSPGHTIDRRYNDGNYEPDNCRWATRKEQDRNKKTNRFITNDKTGETLCVTDWALKIGGKTSLVRSRLASGWDIQTAITTPKLNIQKRDETGVFVKSGMRI